MFPAGTNAGGMCTGAPDVCKTPMPPPVGQAPIPYPNLGQLAVATPMSMKVLIEMRNTLTESSEIPVSSGDEAGVIGGVVSGCNVGKVVFRMGSTKVSAEGKPVIYQTGMTAHNGSNPNVPVGVHAVPSQMKVLIFP